MLCSYNYYSVLMTLDGWMKNEEPLNQHNKGTLRRRYFSLQLPKYPAESGAEM